jgi:hypothetical protein
MIAPARAQYKIPLEWLICAPRTTLTTDNLERVFGDLSASGPQRGSCCGTNFDP